MRTFINAIASTEGPVVDLTTSADVVAELGLPSADAAMAGRITRASNVIASLCCDTFATQDWEQKFFLSSGESACSLMLSRTPVQDIIAVLIDDAEVDAGAYEFDADTGTVFKPGSVWSGGKIVVTFTAGYDLPSQAPGALARACIELVKEDYFATSRDPSVRQISHGDASVSYWVNESGNAVPQAIRELIAPYKRLAV